MSEHAPKTGMQLRSLLSPEGRLELSLAEVEIAAPGPDEVLIRIEATPINPSDLGLLLGPADPASLVATGSAARPAVAGPVSAAALKALAARVGESMPVGNEGAGTVIAAGETAKALIGRTVAAIGGAMYAQYRTVRAADCLVLPEGVTAREGASCFVNPLTALGMIETMKREGHSALVHTAAASNLGQMLNRACQADGIALVNIVRSPAQAELLRSQGARHVLDTSTPDFQDALIAALDATGATLGFDAIGGGRLAGQILSAMEVVASRKAGAYSRYGSSVHKQVYIYGALDLGPTELVRSFGMSWGLGGWLLTPFLMRIGPEAAAALRERVGREIRTTFASHYDQTISLRQALDPAVIAAYARRATGGKYLIDPSLP